MNTNTQVNKAMLKHGNNQTKHLQKYCNVYA